MDDAEFLKQFEAGTIAAFPHREHIRMAWLILRADGFDKGCDHIRAGVQNLARAKGAPGLYHETITLFWIYLVQHAISLTPEIDTFAAFIAAYPHLLDSGLLKQHYSPALISTARGAWAAPNLKPLPSENKP
jgi:hypothetical protein